MDANFFSAFSVELLKLAIEHADIEDIIRRKSPLKAAPAQVKTPVQKPTISKGIKKLISKPTMAPSKGPGYSLMPTEQQQSRQHLRERFQLPKRHKPGEMRGLPKGKSTSTYVPELEGASPVLPSRGDVAAANRLRARRRAELPAILREPQRVGKKVVPGVEKIKQKVPTSARTRMESMSPAARKALTSWYSGGGSLKNLRRHKELAQFARREREESEVKKLVDPYMKGWKPKAKAKAKKGVFHKQTPGLLTQAQKDIYAKRGIIGMLPATKDRPALMSSPPQEGPPLPPELARQRRIAEGKARRAKGKAEIVKEYIRERKKFRSEVERKKAAKKKREDQIKAVEEKKKEHVRRMATEPSYAAKKLSEKYMKWKVGKPKMKGLKEIQRRGRKVYEDSPVLQDIHAIQEGLRGKAERGLRSKIEEARQEGRTALRAAAKAAQKPEK